MRISSGRFCQNVRVACATREFYPIEILEHFDREVAADLRAVAERRRRDLAARARLFGRHLFEAAHRLRQEEARFRYTHHEPLAREARERALELARIFGQPCCKLCHGRRTQGPLAEQRANAPP